MENNKKEDFWKKEMTVSELEDIYNSQTPPTMPIKLPKFIKYILKNTPKMYQPAYSIAVFPVLGTHTFKLKFEHTNRLFYPPHINCIIVGGSGVGKNSAFLITKHLLHVITIENDSNLAKLAEFNDRLKRLPHNAKKPERPKGLIQQIVYSDTTYAALCLQMKEAEGHVCYLEVKEIEDLYNLQVGRGGKSPLILLREADDPDGFVRQRRATEQGFNINTELHLNYLACTTPAGAIDFYRKDAIKGALSRAEIAYIPSPAVGSDEPEFGVYDSKYDDRLWPFIENLRNTHGDITCKQAIKLVKQLKRECSGFAQATQDSVWDDMTHRALTHATIRAYLLYVANGNRWDKTIESYVRWSLHYTLWNKMQIFGDLINDAESKVHTSRRGVQNLLTKIKNDIFTFEDILAVRQSLGRNCCPDAIRNNLNQWVSREYIERMPNGSFRKLTFKTEDSKQAKN